MEVPPLTEAYQDARKAYALSSSLLMALELIGIDFGATPIQSISVTLKSPQAVPYVLIASVVYFSFRFTVEWYQNNIERRSMIASRVDFSAAHFMGICALSLYGVQTLLKVQLANEVQPSKFVTTMIGVAFGQVCYAFARRIRRFREDTLGVVLVGVGLILLLMVILYILRFGSSLIGFCAIGALVSILVQFLVDAWAQRQLARSRQSSAEG